MLGWPTAAERALLRPTSETRPSAPRQQAVTRRTSRSVTHGRLALQSRRTQRARHIHTPHSAEQRVQQQAPQSALVVVTVAAASTRPAAATAVSHSCGASPKLGLAHNPERSLLSGERSALMGGPSSDCHAANALFCTFCIYSASTQSTAFPTAQLCSESGWQRCVCLLFPPRECAMCLHHAHIALTSVLCVSHWPAIAYVPSLARQLAVGRARMRSTGRLLLVRLEYRLRCERRRPTAAAQQANDEPRRDWLWKACAAAS